MAPIIWRTMVEIRDDYDTSVLVQVVDWCKKQLPGPTPTESRYMASPGQIVV